MDSFEDARGVGAVVPYNQGGNVNGGGGGLRWVREGDSSQVQYGLGRGARGSCTSWPAGWFSCVCVGGGVHPQEDGTGTAEQGAWA